MKPLLHTVDLYTVIDSYSSYLIDKILLKNNLTVKKYPGKSGYHLKLNGNYGFKKVIINDLQNYSQYLKKSINIRLNPKTLIEKDNYAEITYFEELETIKNNFNKFISSFEGLLPELDDWNVKRNDSAIDIMVEYPECQAELFKGADILKKYQTIKKKEIKDSIYIECSSVVVNCYPKEDELKLKFPECKYIDRAKGKIRLEIQCKYSKVMNLVKKYNLQDNTFKSIANPEITRRVVKNYLSKILRTGDYYSMKEAKKIVRESDYSQKAKKNMLEVLDLVKRYKSIWRAREAFVEDNYGNEMKFNKYLYKLDSINVNPVTLPKRFKIKKLTNLVNMIDNQFYGSKYFIEINI